MKKIIFNNLDDAYQPKLLVVGEGSYYSKIISYFGAQVIIGSYTSIGKPLFVHGNSEHAWSLNHKLVSTYPFKEKWNIVDYPGPGGKGFIRIGSDVWIGRNVTLLSGVTIGDGAIIGTETVVAKDIPPFAIAVGNPVQVIRYRFSPQIIKKLLSISWWKWDKEKIRKNLNFMRNIEVFVEKFYKKK